MNTIAFDTEATGLYRHQGHRMFGFSVCDTDGNSEWLRLNNKRNKNELGRIWNDTQLVKVGHNMKFDLGMVEAELGEGSTDGNIIHDTMLEAHVFQNDFMDKTLKRLAWELAGFERDDEREVKAFVKEGGDYSHVPQNVMARYAAQDAERTMLLHLFFYPKIKKNAQWLESYTYETKLIPVTLRMENKGMLLDVNKTKSMRDKLLTDAELCLDAIEEISGHRINPASPQELQWLLFEQAGLPVLEKTEKAHQPKTSKDILSKLKDKFPNNQLLDLVLQYRSWKKGAATFQRYLNLRDSGGIIHPSIHTCAARTGRESCSDPNLQNVQKDAALLNPYPVPERSVFRPRPGYVWFAIDYSGIELRLLVHYSGDEELIKCIRKNEDVHVLSGPIWYRNKWDSIVKDPEKFELYRDALKGVNFGIPYGANFTKVAKTLQIPLSDAKTGMTLYRARWPGLANLNQTIAQMVRANGYIDTTFGRRLFIPRDLAYKGANYLIQGTAAEILKRAQVRAWDYCQKATGGEVYPILPIHDEIIFEYPRTRLKDARDFLTGLTNVMTDFSIFNVPLTVKVELITASWNKKRSMCYE